MKRAYHKLGSFEMTSDLMRVSNPCYDKGVWCSGTIPGCMKGKERPDGMSLSRVVRLVGGSRSDYLLIADSGPGEQSGKGLIVPRFGKNPEQHVAVGLTWRGVNEILITTAAHYQAWLSAKYTADWTRLHAPRLEGKPRAGKEESRTPPPPSEPPPLPQSEEYGFGSIYGM